MHLPDVENLRADTPESERILQMEEQGIPIPQILHLFAFKPDQTRHLSKYAEAVMRGDGPLSYAQRETIAALTSNENHCLF